MGRKEMIARARSAFKEVLVAMEKPNAQLLQRNPDIKGLVETIVQKVEAARDPENWPVEEYPDEFSTQHPADRFQWRWLLNRAAFIDRELADTLCIIRGMGCELVRDGEYGYIIRPIIGAPGKWETMEQYNMTKAPLGDHVGQLLPLLKKLRAENDAGRVVPASELEQTDIL